MAVVVSSRNNSPSSSKRQQQPSSWMGPWLLFVLGCVLGHWHGRYYSAGDGSLLAGQSSASSSSLLLLHNKNNNDNPHTTACNCVEDGNGWNSIQVFYGRTDLLDDSSTTSSSASALVLGQQQTTQQQQEQRRLLVRWYSQAKQDELVHALLRNKTHGYFVDLAANDATVLSNTYALETEFHWKGVCIEPNPIYWANLTLQRPNCTIVGAVVGAARLQPVYFRFEAGDHGGIADAGFDNGKRWQPTSERRYTVPLLEILRDRVPRGGAPVDIDYLSLDVEGAETFIMRNFPLNEYRIKIITAERLRGEIRGYLKEHGYEFVARLTRWGESLWVHESAREELDWSALDRFGFPL